MSDMRFWYPASITQITSINESFDSCILRVCYAGRNRNQSIIPKEAIEQAIPTMAYCPIVANYDVASDTIGGHDVGFVEDENDVLKMINLTDAIGVIPENPQWTWESVTEEDGTVHEYLCTPAILWKRTPVYSKLVRDGVSGQSMEISVREGKVVDGLFKIEAFDFTAFCLLGEDVEPCFESAQVSMFSMDRVGNRLSEMMEDFKKNFSKVIAASADDNITPKGEERCLKGGKSSLNVEELLKKYGLTVENLNFSTDGLSIEELEQRLSELREALFSDDSGEDDDQQEGSQDGLEGGQEAGEGDGQQEGQSQEGSQEGAQEGSQEGDGSDSEPEEDDDDSAAGRRQQYSLTGEQMWNEIMDALHTVMYKDEWGEWPRYCYTDYDPAVNEIYAYDSEDWNLYGFKYTMNGDHVVIDFESKTRKKLAFVDYENGSAQFNYKHMFDNATERFNKVVSEVNELRKFKADVEKAERKVKVDEVFARFNDLAEDERFKALKENCEDMSVQDIEDKCYAIRGRNVSVSKFALNTKSVRLPVNWGEKNEEADEPYGGLFVEYGIAGR